MLIAFKIRVKKMKVRFLHDWREINKGTVRDMSEFDIIRLQDLGVVEKLNRFGKESGNRRYSIQRQMPEQSDNPVRKRVSHSGG